MGKSLKSRGPYSPRVRKKGRRVKRRTQGTDKQRSPSSTTLPQFPRFPNVPVCGHFLFPVFVLTCLLYSLILRLGTLLRTQLVFTGPKTRKGSEAVIDRFLVLPEPNFWTPSGTSSIVDFWQSFDVRSVDPSFRKDFRLNSSCRGTVGMEDGWSSTTVLGYPTGSRGRVQSVDTRFERLFHPVKSHYRYHSLSKTGIRS